MPALAIFRGGLQSQGLKKLKNNYSKVGYKSFDSKREYSQNK